MGGRGASSFYSRYRTPRLTVRPSNIEEKPWDKLTEDEQAGIRHLRANGIEPFAPLEDPAAAENIDLVMNGKLYEMKNVTNKTSSVGNQIARVRKKWWKMGLSKPVRAVFTTENASDSFDEIADEIFSRKRDDEEFIVLSDEGEMRTQ